MRIPTYVQYLGAEDKTALNAVFDAGLLEGNGPVCQRVQQQLQKTFRVRHALLTPSCYHALEMAMRVLDIGPGDEVIVPSYAYVANANCVVQQGATPVFADIEPQTLNIDPQDVVKRITPHTKAIIVSHYGGNACALNSIVEIATKHNLYIIENASDAVDAKYKGCYLGTIGHIGCLSFHAGKNLTCGEGGAFVTNDDELAEKARLLHNHGTNRAEFISGEVTQYSWQAPGGNYALSDLLAAILEVQLKKRADIKLKRELVYKTYCKALRPLVSAELITLPQFSSNIEPNYHLFYFHVTDIGLRDTIVQEMHNHGIMASAHFIPLHRSPLGQQFTHPLPLPVSEQASQSIIRLPIYPNLSERAALFIVKTLKTIYLQLLDSPVTPSEQRS